MKTITGKALTIIIGLVFINSVMVAQEQTWSNQSRQRGQIGKFLLTEAQKVMLKENQKKRTEMKEAFRTTLSKQEAG